MSELQELVDALAERIGRSVVIDDQRFQLVVFSSHMHDSDDVRRLSILRRQAPDEAVDWLIARGVRVVLEPLRIEPAPHLGMRARVCIPIRFDGLLLGYLCVIEDQTRLSDDDLKACVEAVGDAAPLMYRERFLHDHTRERERHCVVDLLDAVSETRLAAARAALDDGLLLASGAYGAIAVESTHVPHLGAEERTVAVLAALERIRRALRPHGCVVGNLGARGVLIAPVSAGPDGSAELSQVTRRLLSDLRASGAQVGDWRLGQGPPVRDLTSVVVSYRAALDAIRISAAVPHLGEVAAWEELGAWKLLSRIADDDGVRAAIHPALVRLARLRDGEVLLRTLEVYLDSGGDAQTTAGSLCIHRTSLYARLRRIERTAAVNLAGGEDRLALHISLRLKRLIDHAPAYSNVRDVPALAS